MEVESQPDWMVNRVELLKKVYGYERKGTNDKIGSIDYVANGEDQEEKLLRVIPEPGPSSSRVDLETTKEIVESLEKQDYDKVVVIAKDFTDASKRLLGEENIEYITLDKEHRYSIYELMDAIHKVTHELCRIKCGRVPTSERDCKGLQAGEYACPVRLTSDNADFHAERGWLSLLKKDFSKLTKFRKEVNE